MEENYVPFEGIRHLQQVVKEHNQRKDKIGEMGIKVVPNKGLTAYIKGS